MDAGTSRDDGLPPRATDHARTLIRKAQLALAGLAVPVAMVVGVATAAGSTPASTPSGLGPVGARPTSGWVSPTPGSVAGLAQAEVGRSGSAGSPAAGAEMTGFPAAGPRPAGTTSIERMTGRPLDGVLAALLTLLVCWGLLAGAGAVWRRRLAARDLRDWADGWARVEPRWSGRTV